MHTYTCIHTHTHSLILIYIVTAYRGLKVGVHYPTARVV